jgi:hypothetical protein
MCLPPVGFETTTTGNERPQNHVRVLILYFNCYAFGRKVTTARSLQDQDRLLESIKKGIPRSTQYLMAVNYMLLTTQLEEQLLSNYK